MKIRFTVDRYGQILEEAKEDTKRSNLIDRFEKSLSCGWEYKLVGPENYEATLKTEITHPEVRLQKLIEDNNNRINQIAKEYDNHEAWWLPTRNIKFS